MMRVLPSSFLCRFILISVSSLFFFASAAQSNLRCKTIPTNAAVKLDSILIEPGSIQLSASYEWADSTQTIIVSDASKPSVEVCYRVLSTLVTKTYESRSLITYDDSKTVESIKRNTPIEKEELFDFGGVTKYGAISRGISFGNRQSLFVNSTLNLQMDGQLDDNLFISAVITDQNIPYQPEGNTQQIRDFDNVFIKLYNTKFDLTVGDIVLREPDDKNYFLRYYKNVQGGQISYRGGKEWKHETRISGALSKGKFNSAILEPIDGINGPYRLRGPNGERFIIVLANSEKVFIDGKLLQRGFDRDYVIDYNLGEVTFNNHIVITQFSIIRVDFEYAEQFYSRSNLSAYQSVSNGKLKFTANYYRERDNPNANLGFSLNEDDLNQLALIGDNLDQAFITGFDSVQFSENRILYLRKDTVDLDGNAQTIFENSVDPDQVLFSPTFSEVGTNNGDYVLRQTTANGRIYEWVSPINGQPQGNYQPGAFVPLPNSRQLMTLSSEVDFNTYETGRVEVAFSNTDNNLYSDLDDADNNSRAYFMTFDTKNRSSFIDGYKWVGKVSMEYDEQNFTFIDRYRSILFDRDWNFNNGEVDNSDDLLLFLSAGIVKDEANKFQFNLNRRKRGNAIDGWQQQVDFNEAFGDFQLVSSHFRLSNDQENLNTDWIRSRSDLSYRRWKVAPGFIYEVDQNKISEQDSVINTLMNFRAQEWYLTNTDSAKSNYRIGYRLRTDQLPRNGELEEYLFSKNLNASYNYSGDKGSITADLNYRSADVRFDTLDVQDEVINGRVNWIQSFLDRNVRSNFSYSTGNSRELRREFIYLPVNGGEGTHTWRDSNGDGVQDLNEFFEAINPDERNFVKIFTPTDDYIIAFQTFFVHTIDARFPRKWSNQGGVKHFASKLSANLNFNINFKTTANAYEDRLNPFALDLNSSDLIAVQDGKRYTLFYNRNGRGFGGDFTYQTSDNKQLLIQGFELRKRQEWVSNVKVDISSEYTFRVTTTIGSQLNQSDFLDSRNFDLSLNSYKPQLIWQPSNVLRVIGSYERKSKRNTFTESSDESSTSQIYSTELTFNQPGKGSLRGVFSLVKIDFTGDPASYLGYLLLDALQPGTNQTWQVNWQQKVSKGMQLSLIYNGRKSEASEAIHTGSVQVTAFF